MNIELQADQEKSQISFALPVQPLPFITNVVLSYLIHQNASNVPVDVWVGSVKNTLKKLAQKIKYDIFTPADVYEARSLNAALNKTNEANNELEKLLYVVQVEIEFFQSLVEKKVVSWESLIGDLSSQIFYEKHIFTKPNVHMFEDYFAKTPSDFIVTIVVDYSRKLPSLLSFKHDSQLLTKKSLNVLIALAVLNELKISRSFSAKIKNIKAHLTTVNLLFFEMLIPFLSCLEAGLEEQPHTADFEDFKEFFLEELLPANDFCNFNKLYRFCLDIFNSVSVINAGGKSNIYYRIENFDYITPEEYLNYIGTRVS